MQNRILIVVTAIALGTTSAAPQSVDHDRDYEHKPEKQRCILML
jgi:hypothetical protein